MKRFKARGLLVVMVLSAVLAGCGVQDKPSNNQGGAATETVSPSPSPEPTAVTNVIDAAIYLTDAELTETIEQTVKLSYETEADLVAAAIAELQKDAAGEAVALWKPIEVKSVILEEGLVTLDIHLPDEARLGAPGESIVIETLKQTLFQFEFVKSIQLLVDGAEIDTLMGHVELEHPMLKE
ncbi:GerMN domain-containing protein [Paenibacillus sinopodophylli]|uniref:GerMN domain-containing protein n=1 Tax=Paenibacillus sinopodophylli TaxID=1837342 RepID=UPI00110CD752|nr:GerMN domain-containing protein [Paenibacillus sinopodophylli]